ncbi:hypothetical protein [Streptomyces sp. NBC_01451]|uniref:hypothetical protein n=1 Tax=Streptomyces sp. NBC_01451 TaxID=2903872 RepID=UPI002E36C9E5|nr:hypothetical protein [Streptomyces sp. NBC_01451]
MNDDTAPQVLDRLTRLVPLRRVGHPEEAAEAIAFPSSGRVGFATGAVYDTGGGRVTC